MKTQFHSRALFSAALAGIILAACGKKGSDDNQGATTQPVVNNQPPVATVPDSQPLGPGKEVPPAPIQTRPVFIGPYQVMVPPALQGSLTVRNFVTNATASGSEMWELQGSGPVCNSSGISEIASFANSTQAQYCHISNNNKYISEYLAGQVFAPNSIYITTTPNWQTQNVLQFPVTVTVNRWQQVRGLIAQFSRFDKFCSQTGATVQDIKKIPTISFARGVTLANTQTAAMRICTTILNDAAGSGKWTAGVIEASENRFMTIQDFQSMVLSQYITTPDRLEISVLGFTSDWTSFVSTAEKVLLDTLTRIDYSVPNTPGLANGGTVVDPQGPSVPATPIGSVIPNQPGMGQPGQPGMITTGGAFVPGNDQNRLRPVGPNGQPIAGQPMIPNGQPMGRRPVR